MNVSQTKAAELEVLAHIAVLQARIAYEQAVIQSGAYKHDEVVRCDGGKVDDAYLLHRRLGVIENHIKQLEAIQEQCGNAMY